MWKTTVTILSSPRYELVVFMNRNKRLFMWYIWGVEKVIHFWEGNLK